MENKKMPEFPFAGNVHIDKFFNNVETYNEYHEPKSNHPNLKAMREALDMYVMPYVRIQRHMFCVMKGLMHNGYVADGDFIGAETLLCQLYPEGLPYVIGKREISELNSLSMSKDIDYWDADNQPVGKPYPEYKTIAVLTSSSLPNMKEK